MRWKFDLLDGFRFGGVNAEGASPSRRNGHTIPAHGLRAGNGIVPPVPAASAATTGAGFGKEHEMSEGGGHDVGLRRPLYPRRRSRRRNGREGCEDDNMEPESRTGADWNHPVSGEARGRIREKGVP